MPIYMDADDDEWNEYRTASEIAEMARRDADDYRRWQHLQAVDGYGPHGLCDCCHTPLESLSELNEGRCTRCVIMRLTPEELHL